MRALLKTLKLRILATGFVALASHITLADGPSEVLATRGLASSDAPRKAKLRAHPANLLDIEDTTVLMPTAVVPVNPVGTAKSVSTEAPLGDSANTGEVATPTPSARPKFLNVKPMARPSDVVGDESAAVPTPPKRSNLQNTEAVTGCPYADGRCYGTNKNGGSNEVPAAKVAGLADAGKYHSVSEACYSAEILAGARRNSVNFRKLKARQCAIGVRTSLGNTGVYDGHSLGPGALDYAIHGKLEALGFKNFISEYPTPDKAPPGAVLVFGGPQMANYIHTGHIGEPPGEWVGHITIKGDAKHDGNHFYAARITKDPTWSYQMDRHRPHSKQRRPLVGVYLMQKCTAMCKSKLRDKCG